jgi:hypothetical protein
MTTARPSGSRNPVAFMSYAQRDDEDGRLSRFCARLEHEFALQTGSDVWIFKDRDDIEFGEQCRERLDDGLARSMFLLPIITPSFVMSPTAGKNSSDFGG